VTEATFAQLMAQYAEPRRAYHTAAHLAAMFSLLDRTPFEIARPDLLAWAIWYHDAVYDPRASDNESESARLFQMSPIATSLSTDEGNIVIEMILATKNHVALTQDQAVLIDLDLSILGEDAALFDAYDAAIRAEYRFVPAEDYAIGRSKVLRIFQARPAIYASPLMADFERRAKSNIARSLARLAQPDNAGV
jgi:predicted metal-dependent HD superfamily phosphohydrolase